MTIAEIFREVELMAQWLAGGKCVAKEDLAKGIGIKRVSILFELEYSKVLELLKLLKFLHELKFHST